MGWFTKTENFPLKGGLKSQGQESQLFGGEGFLALFIPKTPGPFFLGIAWVLDFRGPGGEVVQLQGIFGLVIRVRAFNSNFHRYLKRKEEKTLSFFHKNPGGFHLVFQV